MAAKLINITLFALFIYSVITCTDKFDLPDSNPMTPSNTNFSDTLFIQKFPIWDGFNKPQDIIFGRETFIYVADTDNDRIVMLNVAGQILSIKNIKRPIALAQDYRLNLFVCAEFDTMISGNAQSFSAVYKINLVNAGHDIASASIRRILPRTSFDLLRPDRKYTGICAFYDNSYYVARTGPANSNPIDPDNSILKFRQIKRNDGTRKDTLIGRVPLLQPEGTGLLSTSSISSLTSFSNNTKDIIVTLTGENSFKTQWWRYIVSERFEGYQNALEPFATSLMTVNKFNNPEGVALDNAENIYVADAEKDSVYKFNSSGDEMESFGGSELFNSPHAVAYFEGTLYVADTENNRILRFTLSTEIE